jgi:hypothetical protein
VSRCLVGGLLCRLGPDLSLLGLRRGGAFGRVLCCMFRRSSRLWISGRRGRGAYDSATVSRCDGRTDQHEPALEQSEDLVPFAAAAKISALELETDVAAVCDGMGSPYCTVAVPHPNTARVQMQPMICAIRKPATLGPALLKLTFEPEFTL